VFGGEGFLVVMEHYIYGICVRERVCEKQRERECARERACDRERERECVLVCVRKRERGRECVC